MGSKTKFYADLMSFNSEVTGSCTLCSVRFPDEVRVRFLVDCGLFQERSNESLNKSLEFNPDSIDFVLVTHSHVDHIGRLPLLVKYGYRGPIYASNEVANHLMGPALSDCQAVIAASTAVKSVAPLYSEKDVSNVLHLTEGKDYFDEWSPHERIKVTFFQNAHVLGAVIIFVQIKYENDAINLLFTGDYNDKNSFFCARKLPERITSLPITIIEESTYGTTDSSECQPIFEERFKEVLSEYYNILLLAYSFGRTQEILYKLKCMQQSGSLPTDIPIYLDGKLGIKYTHIFPRLNISERTKDFLPENFHYVEKSARDELMSTRERKIIITSSGTGSFGPAQFYLPHFLPNKTAYVAFTGYTPRNTLGHRLQNTPDGTTLKVGGVVVTKRAKIEYFNEFSAHAKADVLVNFLKDFTNLKLVLINHGEPETKLAFAERVKREVNPKMIGILDRDYWFRVDQYGYVKSVTTKFG
ncbi:MAG: MBL fold metallo-hydrolase [Clostridia bacterium]|nr:MBL fold metallo-hydrolase [Clostridia bacterium]